MNTPLPLLLQSPPPSGRMKPKSSRKHGQNWDVFKPDIYQFYKDNSLKDMMAEFGKTNKLQAKKRRWKQKLLEWGIYKNDTKRKRAAEDNATIFSHWNARNSIEGAGDFKRRKISEESANSDKATPPRIQRYTPDYENMGDLSENMCKGYPSIAWSHSATSNLSGSQKCLACSPGSKMQNTLLSMATLQEVSAISMLDRYLQHDIQPFPHYMLAHQLGNHDAYMHKLRDSLSSITELLDLPEDPPISPVFCCADNGFLLDCDAPDRGEEADETNSEVVALEELFDLAVVLADHQQRFGELDERTLAQEFMVAKLAKRNNLLVEAEHRCRRILGEYPYSNVQSFLGLLLANPSNLKESSSLLFAALAGFMAYFEKSSFNQNVSLLTSIELLYVEVIQQSDLDLTSMSSYMCQIIKIQNLQTEENSQELFPQLLIHGFSVANECANLGMVDSAKNIYQKLLQYAPLRLKSTDHGMEMTDAYQKYGALLRIGKEWKLSAEQLQLACECAARAGLHNNQLTKRLEDDYNHLLPHLTGTDTGEESTAERVKAVLDQIAFQVPLHIRVNKAGPQVSRISQNLLSLSLYNYLNPLARFDTARLELSSRASGSMQGDCEHSSTLSTIESGKYGETYSDCQVSGISDSEIFGPKP